MSERPSRKHTAAEMEKAPKSAKTITFGMDREHAVKVVDHQNPEQLKKNYAKAFVTKYKRGTPDPRPKIKTEAPSDVPKKMMKQWYPMGTWFVDLVNFEPMWYVFFVEANSRFLIAFLGNAQMANKDTSYTTGKRVPSIVFGDVFNKFLAAAARKSGYLNSAGLRTTAEPRPVKHLIGDSERAFWTPSMARLYRQHGIDPHQVNCKQEGHRRLAILDRVVRTIRDMNFKTHYDAETNTSNTRGAINPIELKRLADVYNHTWHRTLSEAIGGKISPNDVHFNEALERKVITHARVENYMRRQQSGMLLDIGEKVLVKNDSTGTFDKKRSRYIDGIWTVLTRKGNAYTLTDEAGAMDITKPRSELVRIRGGVKDDEDE